MLQSSTLVEAAKSGRASCRMCQQKIVKGELRVGTEVHNPAYGATWQWRHVRCFKFTCAVEELTGFASLDSTAQETLRAAAAGGTVSAAAASAVGGGHARRPKPKKRRDGRGAVAGVEGALSARLKEEMPLAQGICKIEYAKAKKPSACSHCGVAMVNGEPRIGNATPSPFFEGFQFRWLHIGCALPRIRRLSQLQGWDRMGYDASLEIREATGEKLSSEREHALRLEMEAAETMQEAICANMSIEEMQRVLSYNGIVCRDLGMGRNSIDMAIRIADGIMFGNTDDCPVCGNAGLVLCAGRIACWGFLDSAERCAYRAPKNSAKRYRFLIPARLAQEAWLAPWLGKQQAAAAAKAATRAAEIAAAAVVVPARKLKMEALRAELEGKHGLSTSGLKKAELVAALVAARGGADKDDPSSVLGADGKRKAKKRKQTASWADSAVLEVWGGGGLGGLSLALPLKASDEVEGLDEEDGAAAASSPLSKKRRRCLPPPEREVPQEGSPILEVHPGYKYETSFAPAYRDVRVLVDDDGVTVYNASLTDVNVSTGLNRFYIVQAHEVRRGASYQVFCHWGRIGQMPGFNGKLRKTAQVYPCASKADCVALFKQWFSRKTGNDWDNRHNFCKTPLGYVFGELSTVSRNSVRAQGSALLASASASAATKTAACTLSNDVQALVELLFDEDTILNAVKDQGIDLDEMPLGALTQSRVEEARSVLDEIAALLMRGSVRATASSSVSTDDAAMAAEVERNVFVTRLTSASNRFWMLFPSADTPLLDDDAKVMMQRSKLDVLFDIALAQSLKSDAQQQGAITGGSSDTALDLTGDDDDLEDAAASTPAMSVADGIESRRHPTDDLYASLKCELRGLEPGCDEWRTVQTAVANTAVVASGQDGSLCGFKDGRRPELTAVFAVDRSGAEGRFERVAGGLSNRRLLWHGTSVATAAAICSSGLRIMPGSGGRVGRGIYLADLMAKSGYYTSAAQDGSAIMFLAEAALGREFEIDQDSAQVQALKSPPEGYDSVTAKGNVTPDPAGEIGTRIGGRKVVVSTGKPIESSHDTSSSFGQNEFVVFQEGQVRLRYCVRIRL